MAELLSYIEDRLKPAHHCTITMLQRLLTDPLFATGEWAPSAASAYSVLDPYNI
jgi:hypothetical protein